MSRERFEDVSLPREFPTNAVADHEVFMSFINDESAIAFREWWDEKGAILFKDWIERRD